MKYTVALFVFLFGCEFDTSPIDPSRDDGTAGSVAVDAESITRAGLAQTKETTFDLYEATVSTACRAKINTGLNIDYLKQANLRSACNTTLNVGGCSFASGQIYIEDVLHNDQKTHVHEMMHVLLGCQINSTDSGHTNAVWGRINDAF